MDDLKYITYREDRKCYQVKVRANGKCMTRTCKTRDDAIQARKELLRLANLPPVFDDEIKITGSKVVTLQDAYNLYIEADAKLRLKPATIWKYHTTSRRVLNILGSRAVASITDVMWSWVLMSLQKKYNYTKLYMSTLRGLFKSVYRFIIGRGLADANPLLSDRIILQNIKRERTRRAFTLKEKAAFLKEARAYDFKWYFLFKMYFETGCRRGELLALRWCDIDFVNQSIRIKHSIARGADCRQCLSDTKTASSRREIPLNVFTFITLKSIYDKGYVEPNDFVFHNGNSGRWISTDKVGHTFNKIRDKAGLDRCLTIHCIRHTVATQLILNNVDIKTVQAIGGWSKASTVLDVYAHAEQPKIREAMQRTIFQH